MFNFLSERIVKSINNIESKTILNEQNIKDVLREIRIALLESDVNLQVIKFFTNKIKEQCLGLNLTENLNPAQQVIDIVHKELTSILGQSHSNLNIKDKLTTIMIIGVQGSGKTTSVAKLAYYIKNKLKKSVLMVGCDVYRPGALHQLEQLGKQISFPIHVEYDNKDPYLICKNALNLAKSFDYEVVLFDTAGRMQINEAMMNELKEIKKIVNPKERIMIVDSMVGQSAIGVVKEFHEQLNLTGVVLTKTDSDAKGGVAFSINYMTNVPIKFVGTGERIKNLDLFYPNRMADRILNMGDMLSLIETAKTSFNEKSARRSVNRMIKGQFDLSDLLTQMRQFKKMGKIKKVISLIPGAPKLTDEQIGQAEKKLKFTETLINSMTLEEKQNPHLLKEHSRKKRIINGAGCTSKKYNDLLIDWEQMKKGLKNMRSMFANS